MRRVLIRIGWLLDRLDDIAGVFLVAVTVVTFVNVVLRYAFGAPFGWCEEMTAIGLVWMVYLSQGKVEKDNGQLCLTLLYAVVGKRGQDVINAIRSLITMFMSIWLLIPAIGIVMRNYELKMYCQAISFPLWLAFLPLPLAFACIGVVRILDPFVRGSLEEKKIETNGGPAS
jgi:TRAP-type C4-dicarboxylate transport system permease small subunit